MEKTVISVEHLYKQYRIGQVSTGTLAHDLNRWWHRMRGKEDPYEKLTGVNNREENDNSEYVWALDDVTFEVKEGEVLGIIGKNGAGKSTLLKILSKVTGPTKGLIKVRGRIASLLEVGTGFHPELTGRENVYLNGAILGMSKHEIKSKFDEIVSFSGVEKYIDTPVKRYSSGMYVRLAFAVAAHLEPEILIVDEVLAVGDAEFQKRCLGKMQDVSKNNGRTILFVSHNMAAVKTLCTKSIFMELGKVVMFSDTNEVINAYHSKNAVAVHEIFKKDLIATMDNDSPAKLNYARLYTITEQEALYINDDLYIEFEIEGRVKDINLSINVVNIMDEVIVNTVSPIFEIEGYKKVRFKIPAYLLNYSFYTISVLIAINKSTPLIFYPSVIKFELNDVRDSDEKWFGNLYMVKTRTQLNWELI